MTAFTVISNQGTFKLDSLHGNATLFDAFFSLAQAKAERLINSELLASVESDVMIAGMLISQIYIYLLTNEFIPGPALCLYFAALRCTTNPPSVPLPRSGKAAGASGPLDLTEHNCPEPFIRFLRVWAQNVQPIQSLSPDLQHDLARTICGLPPISNRQYPGLNGIAADLRAVAIEIGQRRTFQERYESDLQAALDAGNQDGSIPAVKAKFAPPPMYEDAVSDSGHRGQRSRPVSGNMSSSSESRNPSRSPARSESSNASSHTLLPDDSPAIEFIRETLYAALAEVIADTPLLQKRLRRDPSRAYFAAVGLAILLVSSTSVTSRHTATQHSSHLSPSRPPTTPATSDEVVVVGVLGRTLNLSECPAPLRPLMAELGSLAKLVKQVEEDDLKEAMDAAAHGRPSTSRMENVRKTLEEGVGWDRSPRIAGRDITEGDAATSQRRSMEGRAQTFVNRINALTFSLTTLGTFRERQEDVFKVLAGVV